MFRLTVQRRAVLSPRCETCAALTSRGLPGTPVRGDPWLSLLAVSLGTDMFIGNPLFLWVLVIFGAKALLKILLDG